MVRKVSLGHSLAVMAAVASFGLGQPTMRPAPPKAPSVQRPESKRKRNKRGPLPKGKSEQKLDRSRLICDRSSNVGKLLRWHRTHPREVFTPDETALKRHAWYRKKLFWDAMRAKMNAA